MKQQLWNYQLDSNDCEDTAVRNGYTLYTELLSRSRCAHRQRFRSHMTIT